MVKVSVIMGVYNSPNKEILSASIDSILNQTFKDFELIICDDGSTDDTYAFLSNYNAENKIKIIQNSHNCGLAYSLNKCIAASKGEYIARMDSDDVSLAKRLEEEVKFLDYNKMYSVVGTAINLFDESGVFSTKFLIEKPEKKDLLFNSPFVHPSVMMRKEMLEKINGYRAVKETRRCEDYDLWMRMYSCGYKGYNIQKILFNYREDRKSYKKRKYRYRIDEARVRYNGFKSLGLMPIGYIYTLKPLIIGLFPQWLISRLKLKMK